jgi:xylulokinase
MRELFPNIKLSEIRGIGGGSRSNVWNQIKSDILGVPYVTLHIEDAALLGTAVIAGCGVGTFKDLKETIDQFVKPKEKIRNRLENSKIYKKYSNYYQKIMGDIYELYRLMNIILK